jgi:N-acetylneuraminic acid mutarotase
MAVMRTFVGRGLEVLLLAVLIVTGGTAAFGQDDTGEGPQILTSDLTRRQTITTDTFRVNFVIVDTDPVTEVTLNGEKQTIEPDQAIALTKEIDNRREQTVVTITATNRLGKKREKSYLVLNPSAKGRFGEAAPVIVLQKNQWESAGNLLTPRAAPAAVAYGGLVYVFGGYTKLAADYDTGLNKEVDRSEYVKTAEVFGEKKSPSVLSDAPSFRTLPAAAVLNDKIYVFESRRKMYRFDPKSSAWDTLDSPIQLNRIGPAVASGDSVYILGGQFGIAVTTPEGKSQIETRASPVFWRYTPGTNTWAAQGYMPLPRAGISACAVRDQIFVFGGVQDENTLNRVDVYSVSTKRWSVLSPMPVPRAYASCTVVNGRVLLFGGQGPDGSPLANLDEFTPDSNSWISRAALPTARSQAAAALLQGTTYLAGGLSSKPLDVTEAYR